MFANQYILDYCLPSLIEQTDLFTIMMTKVIVLSIYIHIFYFFLYIYFCLSLHCGWAWLDWKTCKYIIIWTIVMMILQNQENIRILFEWLGFWLFRFQGNIRSFIAANAYRICEILLVLFLFWVYIQEKKAIENFQSDWKIRNSMKSIYYIDKDTTEGFILKITVILWCFEFDFEFWSVDRFQSIFLRYVIALKKYTYYWHLKQWAPFHLPLCSFFIHWAMKWYRWFYWCIE